MKFFWILAGMQSNLNVRMVFMKHRSYVRLIYVKRTLYVYWESSQGVIVTVLSLKFKKSILEEKYISGH